MSYNDKLCDHPWVNYEGIVHPLLDHSKNKSVCWDKGDPWDHIVSSPTTAGSNRQCNETSINL